MLLHLIHIFLCIFSNLTLTLLTEGLRLTDGRTDDETDQKQWLFYYVDLQLLMFDKVYHACAHVIKHAEGKWHDFQPKQLEESLSFILVFDRRSFSQSND